MEGGDNMATKTKVKAEVKEAAVIRPEQLAVELGVSGKQIRAFLRQTYTDHQKRTSWLLSSAQADAVREKFAPADEAE
jgi:hypothetical protein